MGEAIDEVRRVMRYRFVRYIVRAIAAVGVLACIGFIAVVIADVQSCAPYEAEGLTDCGGSERNTRMSQLWLMWWVALSAAALGLVLLVRKSRRARSQALAGQPATATEVPAIDNGETRDAAMGQHVARPEVRWSKEAP